jgi:hypothetical protein
MAPERGSVWEATSGHWKGDVVEVLDDTGQAWVVNRTRHGGRSSQGRRNIPHAYFSIHYELRSPAPRRKGGQRAPTQVPEEITVSTPPTPITNGHTGDGPVWRVRYRINTQEIEIHAVTLLDVASEMEQFAPGCEVVSAEKLAA